MLSSEDGSQLIVRKVASKRYVMGGSEIFVAVGITGASGSATVSLRTRNVSVKKVFNKTKDIPFNNAGEFTVIEFGNVKEPIEFGIECTVIGPGPAFGGKVICGKLETEHQNLRLIFLKDVERTAAGLRSGEADTLHGAIVAEERKILALEILRDSGKMKESDFSAEKEKIEAHLEDLRSDLLNQEKSDELGGKVLLSSTGKKLTLARELIGAEKGQGLESVRKGKLSRLIN